MERTKGIAVIPRHQVALRFTEFPSVDMPEIEKMAKFQVFKELPYSKEEVVISYKNLGLSKKGFTYIMLAIVQRHLAEDIITQNPEGLEHIRLETELLYLYLVNQKIVKEDKVVMALYIKKDCSEIIIIDNTKPVFSRGTGGLKGLQDEISRSMFSYRKNSSSKEIEEVAIVYNLGSDIDALKSWVEGYFSIPVNFYEYKEDIDNVGTLLEIDFLPREYIDKGIDKENTKQICLMCFLFALVMAMLGSLFIFKIQEKHRTILTLAESAGKAQINADQLYSYIKKAELIKSRKIKGEHLLHIFKEIYKVMPPDILLEGLDYDYDGVVYCKGMTRDMPAVFNFIKVLEKSRYFEKVEVKYAGKNENKDQEIADFNIACFTN